MFAGDARGMLFRFAAQAALDAFAATPIPLNVVKGTPVWTPGYEVKGKPNVETLWMLATSTAPTGQLFVHRFFVNADYALPTK